LNFFEFLAKHGLELTSLYVHGWSLKAAFLGPIALLGNIGVGRVIDVWIFKRPKMPLLKILVVCFILFAVFFSINWYLGLEIFRDPDWNPNVTYAEKQIMFYEEQASYVYVWFLWFIIPQIAALLFKKQLGPFLVNTVGKPTTQSGVKEVEWLWSAQPGVSAFLCLIGIVIYFVFGIVASLFYGVSID
jgi:hypothetical protein